MVLTISGKFWGRKLLVQKDNYQFWETFSVVAAAVAVRKSGRLLTRNWGGYGGTHGLRTPREEIAFTAWPKIQSQSQIVKYGRSIFCLPYRPKLSDFFDLCLHCSSCVESMWGDFRMFLNPFGVSPGSSSRKMRLLTEIEAKMKVRRWSLLVHGLKLSVFNDEVDLSTR